MDVLTFFSEKKELECYEENKGAENNCGGWPADDEHAGHPAGRVP